MPSYPSLHFPFSSWFGKSVQPNKGSHNYGENPTTECYACTQVGVPVFHSTSCDNANQPDWEASAGSSLIPIKYKPGSSVGVMARNGHRSGPFGRVLDPRRKRVQRWNRVFLLARGVALAIDPLFVYALSIGREGSPDMHMDSVLVAIVTALRTCVDAVHICHMWRQFRLAYVSRESLVIGSGKLVWDARAIASHYVRSSNGFWFDAFVILPIPQVLFWLVIPELVRDEQVVGGCWYVLAIQRVSSCVRKQCHLQSPCHLPLSCLDVNGPFSYGIYEWALPVVSSQSVAVKILYPIFWGLISLSTFGNILEPTSNWLEVVFSICIVIWGLMLFTLLVGHIQVFLHLVMARKRKMQLRGRDLEWWMKRRQLPLKLRQRVHHFERQRWVTMGGEDEIEAIKDLPEGIRRDIKRFLCLDLIKKVPLFSSLDDLILDNICDRIKPLIFSKDENIIREGDLVQQMVFIVRGHVKSSQNLSKGMIATSTLEQGGFLGDELLSWCLRRPFIDRLPVSVATFTCIKPVEAFGLDASHIRFITEHFRYQFSNERLKRTTRYYSTNWRTWAAVNVQLAWRSYKMRKRGQVANNVIHIGDNIDMRLRRYATMFLSIRPRDHLE
ncbi:unnamed protein product [Cuscuta epithymum]|uniref:Cyclic nucleotide-binding domain-containing protein n=1 Tax=Cuscuta epithymum TaxID=186058 RepID=A0AAV0G6P9_9ASTE|nr:unnamed protein product [Cuscuta epithymum]CAH9143634.1 unnamed protein product [Cuscuta epithymum]